MAEKIIRDPVHDVIAFRLDRPADATLFAVLNSPEFQRLRRIRQLGMASLAYPGADHSRYSHSLGVMQTARRTLEQLSRFFKLDEMECNVCVAGALLHDVGHGPLSHVFERVTHTHHEEISVRIVEDPDSGIHRALAAHDPQMPERVVKLLRGQPPSTSSIGSGQAGSGQAQRSFYCDILSSQLDADRFDYLLRDNLMTGSRYGGFDLTWLLHALTIDDSRTHLAVTGKGISAVEAYLQCRYHMYRNVYFHKVVRTAEGMLGLALQRAKRLAVQGRLTWPQPDDGLFKALLGQRLSVAEYTELDDVSVQHCLKQWLRSDDATLAGLCHGLLYRKLYKTIDITSSEGDAKAIVDRATQAVISAGGDPAYDLFYDEPADTPYEIYDGTAPSSDIWVQDASGRLTSFAKMSPLTQALSRELMFRRIHVAEGYRGVVEGAVRG